MDIEKKEPPVVGYLQQEVFHMGRKWTNIKSLEPVIIQMRKEGRTRQEIADALGLDKVQVKNWISRFNRCQKDPLRLPKPKGRQRKKPMSEAEAMASRIRELEREVDLYRSFLQAAGRM
jgi:transposase